MPKKMVPDKTMLDYIPQGGPQPALGNIPASFIMQILQYLTADPNQQMWNEQIPMASAHQKMYGQPQWTTVPAPMPPSNRTPEGYYPSIGSKDDMKREIMEKFGFETDDQYLKFMQTDVGKQYRDTLYRRK